MQYRVSVPAHTHTTMLSIHRACVAINIDPPHQVTLYKNTFDMAENSFLMEGGLCTFTLKSEGNFVAVGGLPHGTTHIEFVSSVDKTPTTLKPTGLPQNDPRAEFED